MYEVCIQEMTFFYYIIFEVKVNVLTGSTGSI